MAYALAKENEVFIKRMLRTGRFTNQSEVVREALRRMERQENSYLNPPPLTRAEAERIYAPDLLQERFELGAVRKSKHSMTRSIRAKKLKFEDV